MQDEQVVSPEMAGRFWFGGVVPANMGRARVEPAPADPQAGLPVIVRLSWPGRDELVPAQALRWTATAVLVRMRAPGADPAEAGVVAWLRAADVSSSIPPRPPGGWFRDHVSHRSLLAVTASRWPATKPLNERTPRGIPVRPQGDIAVIVRLMWREREELLPARAIRWSGPSRDDHAMVVIKPPRGPRNAELVCWLDASDVSTTVPRRPRIAMPASLAASRLLRSPDLRTA